MIVIVIIGILASITIVSYTGITSKANIATVQADLANASKKINMYYVLYGAYPVSMPNDGTNKYCPSAPTQDTNYCIKPSNGIFAYTPTGSPATDFDLRVDTGVLVYHVTKDSQPTNIATTPITAIGAITGTSQIGQTLTAGAVTPGGATVGYQWQSATTSNGAYTNIAGATSNNLVLNPSNINKYIKVAVTGSGSYSSTQTSIASSQITTDTNWKVMGSQVWATANLNVGTMIAGMTNQSNNSGTNIVEKYCYNDAESNCTTYGGLYQWDEAMKYSTAESSQGICPVGSHIPSDNEWKTLEMSLSGMTQATADVTGLRGTDEGTKLKVGGSSGLNMPFAGDRSPMKTFGELTTSAYSWSSSLATGVWGRYLDVGQAGVGRVAFDSANSFSIRCLGD